MNRSKLKKLEEEDEWVFHGSGSKRDSLDPRQAHHYPNQSQEGRVADGEPAVFASPFANVAVFMAIINKENAPEGYRSGFSLSGESGFDLRATEETMKRIKGANGFVYVLDNNKFESHAPGEVISNSSVQPEEIVEVTNKDLPEDITIEEF